uniref:Spindle assembly abnormal protein 6 N-terminal domain-containing protein n=1 Tax=Aureoumbra lagunensis TaxID=44058 RepID=A0A7S3NJZ4_9STRA|mmetsp:Transcript_6176/g.9200  ORF Transcript_6176/g.9200 Transcript_6176/m.9200 type:complete len:739 (+) Transcript_6176:33-2249(+)
MTIELDRESPLFEAVLPVRMTSESGGSVTDEGTRVLTVRLLLGWRGGSVSTPARMSTTTTTDKRLVMGTVSLPSSPLDTLTQQQNQHESSRGRERVLHMELCDENDAFFLYLFQVSESEFHELRKEHALLVDFASFPRHFIELLERVRDDTIEAPGFAVALEKKRPISSNQRNVSTTINNDAILAVIESNKFKRVTHVALSVRAGDDSAIKSYLAGRLEQASNLNERQAKALQIAQSEHQALENQLKNCQHNLANETQSKLATQAQAESQAKLLAAESHQAKQRALDALRAAYSAQSQTEEQKHTKLLSEWRERAISAERERDVLSATSTELNERLAELTKHNAKLEADAAHSAANLAEERALRIQMTQIKNEADEQRHQAQVQLAAEQRTAIDAKALVTRADDLRTAAEEREARTLSALKQSEAMLTKRDEQIAKAAKEIRRGNHIIDKLSDQLRSLQAKLRLKNDLAKQLERRADDLNKAHQVEIHHKQKALDDLEMSQKSAAEFKQKFELSNAKLNEAQSLIENNNRVIQWLHSQLNSHQGLGFLDIGVDPATVAPSDAFAYKMRYHATTQDGFDLKNKSHTNSPRTDNQNAPFYFSNHTTKDTPSFTTNVISPPSHDNKENTQPLTPPQQATPRRLNLDDEHTPRTAPPPQPSPKDPAAAYFERYGEQDDDNDDDDEPFFDGSQDGNTFADLGVGSPLVTPNRLNKNGFNASSSGDWFTAAASRETTAITAGYF